MPSPSRRDSCLARSEAWTPAQAERSADALGLAPLSERHWRALAACREEAARSGRIPALATIARTTALSRSTLARLFGAAPLAAIATLAGLDLSRSTSLRAPSSRTRPLPRRSLLKEEEPHAG